MEPLDTNFIEFSNKIYQYSFKKMNLKVLSENNSWSYLPASMLQLIGP